MAKQRTGDLDLAAAIQAYARRRAQPVAATLHVTIQPHALVLSPLMLAGVHHSIHAYAIGPVGDASSQVRVITDPRRRAAQDALLLNLADAIGRMVETCAVTPGAYPQIVVASHAAAAHLDLVADRLRRRRDDTRLRRLGDYLGHIVGRWPEAGQQALLVMTDILNDHYATVGAQGEDAHLEALLLWHQPPPNAGADLFDKIAEAQARPMGVRTTPEMDNNLAARLDHYRQARRTNAVDDVERIDQEVRALLTPVVMHIYTQTQRALTLIQESGLPPLPALARLDQIEADAFRRAMDYIASGRYAPSSGNEGVAAYAFLRREAMQESYNAALILGDRVERARARESGDVIVGTVEEYSPDDHGLLALVTSQRLRVRPGDTLYWADDTDVSVQVVSYINTDGVTRLMVRGQAERGDEPPLAGITVGMRLEFVRGKPRWDRLGSQLALYKAHAAITPWTHDNSYRPPS